MLGIEENATPGTTTTTMSGTVNNKKKKGKPRSPRKMQRDAERSKTRVNLGQAFSRWRAMKTRLDMRSDEHLAFFLLDSKLPTVLTVLAEKRRAMTRVNIGSAFHRWSALMVARRLKKHSEVATFLLDWYDRTGPSTSKPRLTIGPLPDRCSKMDLIGSVDSHIQVKQAICAGDAHSCTNDLESSDTAIDIKVIDFSDEENVSPYEEKYFPDEERYFPDEEMYSFDGGGEGTCSNNTIRCDPTGPSTSKPCLTSASLSPAKVRFQSQSRVPYQPRSSDEETLSASESLEERCSMMEMIGTVDSHVQGNPQQAVSAGDPHSCPRNHVAPVEENITLDDGNIAPDEETYFPDDENFAHDEGWGEGTCSNTLRENPQPRYSDEETLSASESLEERFSKMDSIATVDSCIQGKPQQACDTNDPEGSGAAITAIIGFSDEDNVSSEANDLPDEGIDSSDEGEVGEGTPERSSDSDWTPDKMVGPGNKNEEKENDSSVEGGGQRLWDEGEHSSDLDCSPLEHRSINSTSVRGKQTPQQNVPWGDTQSFSNSGENIGKGRKYVKKLRKLCPECGMLVRDLKPHTCEHKIKPYFCNQCGRRFATERDVKIHSRVHKESWKYLCRYCLATFKTKPDKILHEGSHPPSLTPYRCSDCPETFKSFRERREHIWKNHGTGPTNAIFVCPTCDRRFHGKHKLLRHLVVHTGEKQFVCWVCQRSFNQPGHLKSHMRVHTGEKPYQCQDCDKSFNHKVSLKSHIQRYHGQVPDPGMVELDDTTGMEISGLNQEEAERNNDTHDSEEDEEQAVAKKWNNTLTDKGNSRSTAVTASGDQLKRKLCDSDATEEGQGNRDSASDSADEEGMKGSKKMRKTTWRSKGRPKNSEGEEHSSRSEFDDLESEENSSESDFNLEAEDHSSDSDFNPTSGKPKKIGKDRRIRRGRSKNNPLV